MLIVFLLLTGCGEEKVNDNQIYSAERETEQKIERAEANLNRVKGMDPFKDVPQLDLASLPLNNSDSVGDPIILTYSPDGGSVYFMVRLKTEDPVVVLSGETTEKVRLLKFDRQYKETVILAEDIPFIRTVKWNREGTMVAFAGGDRLTIYDCEDGKVLLEEEAANDRVSYFGWSPEGNQLFTEHPNLPNGSVYYLGSDPKLEHAYENDLELYYKGELDDDYSYATWTYIEENKEGKPTGIFSRTVLLDKEGRIVRELGLGRFRDAYLRSMLQVGEAGFGLQYYPDIGKSDQFKLLTEEYVYDAKFAAGGKIVYTAQDRNKINLCIADREGRELASFEVSGGSIALSPDGKTAYIGGKGQEEISLEEGKLVKRKGQLYNEAEGEVYAAILGAMDIYYKHEMTGVEDYEGAKAYFVDSHDPEQWAYFEVLNRFKEMKYKSVYNLYKYVVRVELLEPIKYFGENRASALVGVVAENSMGSGMGMQHSLELIKESGKWYVTGFSTFPDSKEAREMRQRVEKIAKQARAGSLFDGQLNGKEIEVGQIQFWQLSEPHLASKVGNANYCKVYLKVKDNGEEVIYKLVLEKKGNSWKAIILDKERLSYLF